MAFYIKDKYLALKDYLDKNHHWLYSILFEIPWYRITTGLLLIQIYFLKMDIRELSAENIAITKINSEIIANQVQNGDMINRMPNSIWCKRKIGNRYVMQFFNKKFEDRWLKPYGITKYQYYGQTDFAVFPYEAAKQFSKGDSIAAENEERIAYTETFVDNGKETVSVDVIKWREITSVKDTLVWGMVTK